MQKRPDGSLLFSPSDLIKYSESELCTWLDRYALERPNTIQPDGPDEQLQLLANLGLQHEADYLEYLRSEGLKVVDLTDNRSVEATIEAINSRADVIYQGLLAFENFAGIADFIVKPEGQTHYEVWDTKLALKPKPYFILQLCCYAEMLEQIQDVRPKFVSVVLGDRKVEPFRVEDYFYYYKNLKRRFLKQQTEFDADKMPPPVGNEDFRKWQGFMDDWFERHDHLCRVANIRSVQIRRLQNSGIDTMQKLAETAIDQISKMSAETFGVLKQQARLQVESKLAGETRFELLPQNPLDPRRGLALLPPASPNDVFFDMEGYPLVEGGLEYLFGAVVVEQGKAIFKDFWAHNRVEEREAFEKFFDWIYKRWKNDPGMHVYHYAAYETTALKRLSGRYGSRESGLDELLRNEVFVDLYKVVRQSMRVGEPKYSIKNLEHIYRKEGRVESVATAGDSVVYYAKWLEHGDAAILEEIKQYNKVDCESTLQLTEWLRTQQAKSTSKYIPPTEPKESERAERRSKRAAYADELLHRAAGHPVKTLFAQLLEFHWREARPVHWAMFDRHDMTEDELIEDINCLGGLERTKTAPVEPPGSRTRKLYEYRFNAGQDTKLAAEKDCFFAHDLRVVVEVESIDRTNGIIWLKSSCDDMPARLSLIPKEYVKTDAIERSIESIVHRFDEAGELKSCLHAFLNRSIPKLSGGVRLTDDVTRVVSAMDETCLVIQGPPGAGKTFTSANAIAQLLKLGKRVAVTSNSHKAISNLLRDVERAALEHAIDLDGVHVTKKDLSGDYTKVKVFLPDEYLDKHTNAHLVGGTAWLFSKEECANNFDYLFVDEAGQVSLANLVGMSACAENIVLVGDHMQLAQPTQGVHPGDSGLSTLTYYMKDWLEHKQTTIPPDHGIFLATTHRLHADICSFISESIYDSRLKPESYTSRRVLELPENPRYVKRPSGILYVPVQHSGNVQCSEEEVEKIVEIVEELKRCQLLDESGNVSPVTLDKILFVAPYNMQVRAISEAIPHAKVGSVDRFQGQQAPIVIISMCASEAESSPRGMEFLLDKNRLNVALSRAQTLAIVVGSPKLGSANCSRVEQMELANLYCKVLLIEQPELTPAATPDA